MKFAIIKEHREFFQKQGWIEFEDFVSSDQLIKVNQAIDQVLSQRLNTPIDRLHGRSSESLFLQGHDLWRSSPVLRKFVMQSRFAQIASELIERRPLRLGYDQLFSAGHQEKVSWRVRSVYSHLIEQTIDLGAVSCLQGLACGFMLALGGSGGSSDQALGGEGELVEKGVDIFPSQRGHVIFFQPTLEVNWRQLYAHSGERFYCIVYTQALTYYHLQPKDPHTHALKHLGYIFNDRLVDKWNPIVYR